MQGPIEVGGKALRIEAEVLSPISAQYLLETMRQWTLVLITSLGIQAKRDSFRCVFFTYSHDSLSGDGTVSGPFSGVVGVTLFAQRHSVLSPRRGVSARGV